MVTLYLLSIIRNKKLKDIELVACHIIYGNRIESMKEFDIVKEFCWRLNIKLYYFSIDYLRRIELDRDFYENTTRDIRFNVYKSIIQDKKEHGVFLGHIQEDMIENIWSNISKCQHIFDLKKMSIEMDIEGINIVRPFLFTNKVKLLEISHTHNIPYLKNTTPLWSNRGKFRNRFYKETHIQYGESVDKKLIEFSDTLSNIGRILENTIFKPILSSYNEEEKTLNITRAIEAELDNISWLNIFERICHNKLKISKPSIHSINEFMKRISKLNKDNIKIQLKKNLQILVYKEDNNYFIKYII